MNYLKALVVTCVIIGTVSAGFVLKHKSAELGSHIDSLRVVNNQFVVQGENLSRASVWLVSTGTGAPIVQKLGDAKKVDNGTGVQLWELPVPQEPILATRIYAVGFNAREGIVGTVYLPETGATDIYNSLWGKQTPVDSSLAVTASDNNKTFTFPVGDRFLVELPHVLDLHQPTCAPVGIIGLVSNIPDVPENEDIYHFETLSVGSCELHAGDFSVTIVVQKDSEE